MVEDLGTGQELLRPLAQAHGVHDPRVVREGLLVHRLRLEERREAKLPLHVDDCEGDGHSKRQGQYEEPFIGKRSGIFVKYVSSWLRCPTTTSGRR